MNKILLFTLLLFSFSYASSIQDIITQSYASYAIIIIVFLLSALTYMGGSLFSSPNLTARGKDMLYQGIFSLIIMASLPVLYIIFNTIFTSLFLGDYTIPSNVDMFDISENLLLWNYIYYFIHLVFLTATNIFVLTFFGRTYSIPFGDRLVPFNLEVLESPLLFLVNSGVSIITFSMMINGFQLLLLKFVEFVLIPFLLPVGLILRAFPSSMHAGNVLVGIAIASFIIVPIIYAIDLQVLPTILEPNQNIPSENQRVYDNFVLMGPFYQKEVLQNVVINSQNCELVTKSKQYFDVGLIDNDALTVLDKTSKEQCNFDFSQGFSAMGKRIPTYVKVIGSISIGASGVSKGIGALSTTLNYADKLFDFGTNNPSGYTAKFTKWMNGVGKGKMFNMITTVNEGFAVFFLVWFFYEFVLGMATSFIILSVILPFIKFTIIVLFMREFTLNLLGTQVSLGHITRLL